MQGELSVAITGQDTLSPALVAANQKLAETKQAMERASTEADFLRDRFTRLRQQHDLGIISSAKYATELRTLRADMASLANTTKLSTESQALLAQSSAQAASQLRTMSGGMNRAVFGVQSLSLALQGGRVSAQGLTAALTTLGIGSPAFLAVTAGLGVIAALLFDIKTNADDATGALDRARGMGVAGTIQRIQDLALQATDFRDGGIEGNRRRQAARDEIDRLQGVLPILRNDALRGQRTARAGGGGARTPREVALGFGRGQRDKPEDIKGLDETFGSPHVEQGIDKAALAIGRLKRAMDEVNPTLKAFSEAFATGVGAAIDVAASGGHVFEAFTHAVLGALSREARGKAVFEAAEGFAALGKGLLFGDPKALASSAAHFKAAALYGGAAVVTGALAGGGATTAPGSRATGQTGTVGGNGPVNIIQFVTADGREVSRYVVDTAARQSRLGAAMRVPLNGVVLGGPVVRAA